MDLLLIFLIGLGGGYLLSKYNSKAKKLWQKLEETIVEKFNR